MTKRDLKAVLDLPLEENDAGAATIREFLIRLLSDVWDFEEGFSGKRPFGDSGWKYVIFTALIKAGAVEGKVDEDGYFESVDEPAAERLIAEAIRSLR